MSSELQDQFQLQTHTHKSPVAIGLTWSRRQRCGRLLWKVCANVCLYATFDFSAIYNEATRGQDTPCTKSTVSHASLFLCHNPRKFVARRRWASYRQDSIKTTGHCLTIIAFPTTTAANGTRGINTLHFTDKTGGFFKWFEIRLI